MTTPAKTSYRIYSFAVPAGRGVCIRIIRDTDESIGKLLEEPAALAFGETKEEALARAEKIVAALNS